MRRFGRATIALEVLVTFLILFIIFERHRLFHRDKRFLGTIPFKNKVVEVQTRAIPTVDFEENEIIAIVESSMDSFSIRKTIRETWGRNKEVKTLFLVGDSNSSTIKKHFNEEIKDYGDIIWIDVEDNYENLVMKSISILLFAFEYTNVNYIIKIDEDVVVLFDRLIPHLIEENGDIYGYVEKDSKVIRREDMKWFVPLSDYEYSHYPTYVKGPVYAISRKAIPILLDNLPKHNRIDIEDAFVTGILAMETTLQHYDLSFGMHYEFEDLYPMPSSYQCSVSGMPYLFASHGWKTRKGIRKTMRKMERITCKDEEKEKKKRKKERNE